MSEEFNKLTPDLVFDRLLRFGMFPEKLERIFSSELFGNWALQNPIDLYIKNYYSPLEYRLTRNNNSPRVLQIPHPCGYYFLSYEIKENWPEIKNKIGSVKEYDKRSRIIPKPNNKNKRLVSFLSYNQLPDTNFLRLDKRFSKRYKVELDIANCFPSIYSHSISWALVGKAKAKEDAKKKDKWFNKLDFYCRALQRNETIGILVGPDTSNIISELILTRIDIALEKYSYFRFIDDYECYCSSREEVEIFIRELSFELEKYHLKLNTKKTKITELPVPLDEGWVSKLRQYSDQYLKKKELGKQDIDSVSGLLDMAIRLFNKFPNDSPIKYAVKILSKKQFTDKGSFLFSFEYLARICFVFPYFIDVLTDTFDVNKEYLNIQFIKEKVEKELNHLLDEHLKHRRSDVLTWIVYLAMKHDLKIYKFDALVEEIQRIKDCIPLVLCYLYAKKNSLKLACFQNFIQVIVGEQIEDEWWLYIYETYRDSPTKPAFQNIKYKDLYKKMIDGKVTFIK